MDERTKLLDHTAIEGYGNSELARSVRSASVGALGGSSSLGTFRVATDPHITGLPKSYSVSADGSPSYLSPSQLGRQELYQQVPFTAVFGLQKLGAYMKQLDIKHEVKMISNPVEPLNSDLSRTYD